MKLYHGSNVEVSVPDLAKSKPYKDFGQDSICRQIKVKPCEWPSRRLCSCWWESIVSAFEFDEALLQSDELKVKIFEDYSVEWANFILQNRDFHNQHPTHDYDIVYGPIADDGVTFQLRRYQSGAISIEELVRELQYARGITFQYFFGTPLALSKLTKL